MRQHKFCCLSVDIRRHNVHRNQIWRLRRSIFDAVLCDSRAISRFRSEDRVSYSTDAAAMDSVCCFTTFQQGRCLLSEGLEARPSGCRMISLLTTADSKASLIQQRQQRISVCKLSMWCWSRSHFDKFQILYVGFDVLSVCEMMCIEWRGGKGSGDLTPRPRLLRQLPRFASTRETGGVRG